MSLANYKADHGQTRMHDDDGFQTKQNEKRVEGPFCIYFLHEGINVVNGNKMLICSGHKKEIFENEQKGQMVKSSKKST